MTSRNIREGSCIRAKYQIGVEGGALILHSYAKILPDVLTKVWVYKKLR